MLLKKRYCRPRRQKHLAAEDTVATEAAPAEAATVEAETAEDTNLESTFSDIDKMLLNMAAEEAATTAKETLAPAPGKGRGKRRTLPKILRRKMSEFWVRPRTQGYPSRCF
jgi:hypothetical protein